MDRGSERPIGIFDSGLGGLTVLSAIKKRLPSENIIYFGDTARVPYGSKSKDTVIRYSLEILDFLIQKEVKMVVVACNTASSHALSALKEKSPVPVLGVVEPGAKALTDKVTAPEKVAVIATRSTIKSGSYERALEKLNSSISLYSKACPLLVPVIEEGFTDKQITELILREYLDEIVREGIRYIILGCTHYPLLKKTINRLYPDVILIDSSLETAEELYKIMDANQIFKKGRGEGTIQLFVSDITDSLLDMERLFLGTTVHSLEKVSLEW